MSLIDIMRKPDKVFAQTDNEWLELGCHTHETWQSGSVEVSTVLSDARVTIFLKSPVYPVRRIQIRWNHQLDEEVMILNDHWERGYGDLEWRGVVPERVLPWYFMLRSGASTDGYGVKTGAHSMCFWQMDTGGMSLWLDVRCGGTGVQLGDRTLEAARVVCRHSAQGESPFEATRQFCKMMCDSPRTPALPVYGGNNWYYAYGKSSHNEIMEDSKFVSSLSSCRVNRPYMVIDDGWQMSHSSKYNGGPWNAGNDLFPDMQGLAAQMMETGVRPGIWFRPLLANDKIPEEGILTNKRFGPKDRNEFSNMQFMDPSVPCVLDKIREDTRRIVSWGYHMIKHDFTTFDLFGRWGFEMGGVLTQDNWSFSDRSRTTAEIILALYNAIRDAAEDSLVIGCNTVSHLSAGIFEIQRTGDDTSGREWERTRKMGINTLAFRMPQHHAFYAVDADCVGLTNKVPWHMNKQWLELLSKSGTPLFVSADQKAVGGEQKKALIKAFELASKSLPVGEPLDWTSTTCPHRWLLDGEHVSFDWYGENGVFAY